MRSASELVVKIQTGAGDSMGLAISEDNHALVVEEEKRGGRRRERR